GIRATELMCENPGVYLGLRRGDAAALAVAALALIVVPGSAGAAGTSVNHATDPSATADALLFQRLGGPPPVSPPPPPAPRRARAAPGRARPLGPPRPGAPWPAPPPAPPGSPPPTPPGGAPPGPRPRPRAPPPAPRRAGARPSPPPTPPPRPPRPRRSRSPD